MKIKLLALLLLFSKIGMTQVKADDVMGVWLTGGKEPTKIQIYKSGQKYIGKIVWLKNPLKDGKPKLDANNPDKNKRSQQIIGLIILSGFEFDEDKWDDGEIYDPESGKTYDCYLRLLLGRTETWTRSAL